MSFHALLWVSLWHLSVLSHSAFGCSAAYENNQKASILVIVLTALRLLSLMQ